jgi:hypothetical protein
MAEKLPPVILGRVVITRVMHDSGDIVDHVVAESDDGYELGLAEALGMMRLAEDTLIRARYEAADAEDEAYDDEI